MTTPILSLAPFPGARARDVWDGIDEFSVDGPGEVRRLAACPIPYRVWSWSKAHYPEVVRTLLDTIRARHLAGECFYVEDAPRPGDGSVYYPSQRTDVSLGVAGSGQTIFDLPATCDRDEYRDFPIATGLTAKDNGSPATVAAVSTDARKVKLSAAPTAGHTVTVSYRAYRLCRFATSVDWSSPTPDTDDVEVEIREVMRDPAHRIPPPDLRYASPFTWPKDVSIGTVTPYNIGGPLAVVEIVAGALPAGVVMLFSVGSLTGTPTVAGSGTFTVRAYGRGGQTSDVVVAWTVTP